jgi:hypothetical protein
MVAAAMPDQLQTPKNTMTAPAFSVRCPKCPAAMTPVAITPHLLRPGMERHIFICYACNETRTYMLPTAVLAPMAK